MVGYAVGKARAGNGAKCRFAPTAESCNQHSTKVRGSGEQMFKHLFTSSQVELRWERVRRQVERYGGRRRSLRRVGWAGGQKVVEGVEEAVGVVKSVVALKGHADVGLTVEGQQRDFDSVVVVKLALERFDIAR